MRDRTRTYVRLLSGLISSAAAVAIPGACGGRVTVGPEDGGSASGSDDSSFPPSSSTSGSSSGSGSSGTGSSGGATGSSSSSSSGPPCSTVTHAVDASQCVPQLESTLSQGGVACSWTIAQPCFDDAGAEPDACATVCGQFTDAGGCYMEPGSQGGAVFFCGVCCTGGRAPRGFVPLCERATSPRGARLAWMAQLEAASVDAFHALHDDLARLDAPGAMLAEVRSAAKDEVRHARSVGRAAERFGARVPRARVAPIAPRSIEQLAIENAQEGCAEETFGAAVAAVQAERARDPHLRRMMRVIAREELRHAALAWHVAEWLDARLDARARARVRETRVRALDALRAGIVHEGAGDDMLGLPNGATLAVLLEGLRGAIESGHFGPS
jgi:hypothetical protein